MLYHYDLLKDLVPTVIPPTPPPVKPKVGWGGVGKRRIPVELLREILEEQGSPWAKELTETYQEAEKSLATSKSPKQREVLNEVLETVSESVVAPIDWTPILASIRAAAEATRATLAIKHAEAALKALRAEQAEDEEDTELLMQWFFDD